MREDIAILAGPRDGVYFDRWLENAFKALTNCGSQITYRMLKSFWHNEIRDPENHWAAVEIRRAASIVKAQREAGEVAKQIQTLIGSLNVNDPHFHQPTVDALRVALSNLGGMGRSGSLR